MRNEATESNRARLSVALARGRAGRRDMRNKCLWATLSLHLYLGGCIADEELIQISDQYAGVPVANYSNGDGLWRISPCLERGG